MNPKLNVWAMQKDIPLKVLLLAWQHRYGEPCFTLNLAEKNTQAIDLISINHPKLRAYVYTFAQDANCYGIDLYYPTAYNSIGAIENQTLAQTLTILHTHFLD